ncbi:MAG TPA: hypothetical protein VFC00_09095 [Micromonosporaceae bacterium]|nr:hypothetical protein [Micromonosporaceae bacterium]
MTQLSMQIQLAQIEHLLRHIAEDYYTAAKAYHILRATGHPDRIRFHARLKTLAQVGNSLADALHCRRPPWHLFYDQTGRDPPLHRQPVPRRRRLPRLPTGRQPNRLPNR